MNHIDYCLRDCSAFPCDNFRTGPYPFSQGFLGMQERRRQEKPPALDHNRKPVEVPAEYWDRLLQRDIGTLCRLTLAQPAPPAGIVLRCLHEDLRVDFSGRCLQRRREGGWERAGDALLELVTLLYLNRAQTSVPLENDLVTPQDLKEGHYFKGPHALPLAPLLEHYGRDVPGFKRAAIRCAGEAVGMADAAFLFLPLPRIPVYVLLWEGDEEFPPKVSILFNRSIESYFSASGIWALVNLMVRTLVYGPDDRPQPSAPLPVPP
jgi:hypothetical protein